MPVARSPSSPKDAWCHCHAVCLPSTVHHFPSATLPDDVLHDLEVEINQVLSPTLGCDRSTPRQVVFSNSEFADVELRELALEKGIRQLQHFVMSLQTDGIPADLAKTAVSWAQLLTGASAPVMQDTQELPQLRMMK